MERRFQGGVQSEERREGRGAYQARSASRPGKQLDRCDAGEWDGAMQCRSGMRDDGGNQDGGGELSAEEDDALGCEGGEGGGGVRVFLDQSDRFSPPSPVAGWDISRTRTRTRETTGDVARYSGICWVGLLLVFSMVVYSRAAGAEQSIEPGFVSIFDGQSLRGWPVSAKKGHSGAMKD